MAIHPFLTFWWAGIAQWIQRLGYELEDREIFVRFLTRRVNFCLFRDKQNSFDPYPSSIQCLARGLKRSQGKIHHSSSSSTEVRNAWSYTSNPPYLFIAYTQKTLPFNLFHPMFISRYVRKYRPLKSNNSLSVRHTT